MKSLSEVTRAYTS